MEALAQKRLATRNASRSQRTDGPKTPSPEALADPVRFAEDVFGLVVWSRQAEFLRACRDHGRVSVTSGHKTGKSTSFAVLAWWFPSDPVGRPGARVVLSSASARQVKTILWREVKALHRRALSRGYDLPAPALDPETGVRWDDGREILGFTARDPEKMAGVSGAHLLFLLDEASGISPEIFEAIEGNRAGGARIALASNPTQQSGEFFDSHHSKRDLYRALEISSEEAAAVTPHIPGLATATWCAEKRREWGVDSPIYAVRVLGRFPAQSTDAVIGLVYVLDGVARWEDTDASGPLVIGLDVARFGDDETVAVARRGYKVLTIERLPPADGPDTASRFVLWLQGSKLLRANEKPVVNVDAIGVGASVFDALARSPVVDARAVNSGSASTKPHEFTNLRAELHFAGRDWLREGGAIPDDAKLQAEAVAPKYHTDARGRLQVESKDDLRKRLGRSPDASDAWLLSLHSAPPPASYADTKKTAGRITLGSSW